MKGRKLNLDTTAQILSIVEELKEKNEISFTIAKISKIYEERFQKKIYYATVFRHLKELETKNQVKEIIISGSTYKYFEAI